jgi:hypothetical protein
MLRNGAYKRKCQRSGCDEIVYLKAGIRYPIILCQDCRTSEWANDN